MRKTQVANDLSGFATSWLQCGHFAIQSHFFWFTNTIHQVLNLCGYVKIQQTISTRKN